MTQNTAPAVQPRANVRHDKPTLVELLVVVGIIAVLVGILMPSLSAARRSALSTQCLSIQRQIGTAAQMHVQLHRGYYPAAGYFQGVSYATPAALGDSNRQKYTYLWINDINGTPWKQFNIAPWHAALAQYMGKRQVTDGINNPDYLADEIGLRNYLKFFLCPAHESNVVDVPEEIIYEVQRSWWTLQQSYVVNEAVFGIHETYGRLRGQASRVRNPAQTMMLMDGKGAEHYSNRPGRKYITLVNRTKVPPVVLSDALAGNDKATSPGNFDKIRHKGKTNILFMDGHSETRVIDSDDLQNVYLLAP